MIQHALFLLLGIVASMLGLVRQYQMLQQNSYFACRYFKWLKGNLSPVKFVLKAVVLGRIVWAILLGNQMFLDSLL